MKWKFTANKYNENYILPVCTDSNINYLRAQLLWVSEDIVTPVYISTFELTERRPWIVDFTLWTKAVDESKIALEMSENPTSIIFVI